MDGKDSKKRGKIEYPRIKIGDALKLAKTVKECGEYATPSDLEVALKRKGGWLAVSIASTKRWGFIEGRGKLKLTELGRRVFYPQSIGDDIRAKRDAFMQIPLFKKVYDEFKGNFPSDDIFKNRLIVTYSLNDAEAIRLQNIIKDSVKEVFMKETSKEGEAKQEATPFEQPLVPTPSSALPTNLDNNLFRLIEILGILEATGEELGEYINEIVGLSTPYLSLNAVATMTAEELKMGSIDKKMLQIKTKSFLKSLKRDLGITDKEEKEQEKNKFNREK